VEVDRHPFTALHPTPSPRWPSAKKQHLPYRSWHSS